MDISNIATVISIVIITYLIGIGVKSIKQLDDSFIPIIVGVCGGILGVIGFYVIPDFPANNILDAIAIGITNGLTSTGINQIYKQLKGYKQSKG